VSRSGDWMIDRMNEDELLQEADAIIPLDEEQAEALRALSESIKNEQRLETEVARLRLWRSDESLLAIRAVAEGWGYARLAESQADLAARYEAEHGQ